MFGFGKKKDAGEAEAPDPAPDEGGGVAANRARVGLLALALVAGLGYLAYEYLPALLDETPPPIPAQARPKPVAVPVAKASAAPVRVAAAAMKPEPVAAPAPKPEPVAKAEPKPEPAMKPAPEPVAKPAPVPKPVAKPAPKPAPVVMAAAPAPAASASPPAAEPKPAPPPAAPTAVAPPTVAPLRGPPPITPKYNDVMTAVLYGDREAVSALLDLGRWVDKPDSNGLTPLMAAVLARDADMAQLLLERGADPNLQAPGGEVALEMARDIGDGASESLLLKAGARY
jgi:hypothetical protein